MSSLASKLKASSVSKLVFTAISIVAMLAVAAILLIGLYHTTIYAISTSLPKFFVLVLPTITSILALCVTLLTHPVHALLCLITVFFNTACLYLVLGAEFLAFIFLIVYVGAIAILFLFVIMLLNVKDLTFAVERTFEKTQVWAMIVAVPLALAVIAGTSHQLSKFLTDNDLLKAESETSTVTALIQYTTRDFNDILVISELLYTVYSALFMQIALLLLTAMLGAIVLATSTVEVERE